MGVISTTSPARGLLTCDILIDLVLIGDDNRGLFETCVLEIPERVEEL